MMKDPINTDPRNHGEILSGTIPGHEFIQLGGVAYPAKEPTNARARRIRDAFQGYRDTLKTDGQENEPSSEIVEELFDTCIKAFSAEIESDWERIAETATDRERIAAMLVVKEAVLLPFVELAAAAMPEPNRAARRATKTK